MKFPALGCLVILLVVGSAFTGCASATDGKVSIVGTWKLSTIAGVPTDSTSITYKINSDNTWTSTFTISGLSGTGTGTWSGSGSTFTITSNETKRSLKVTVNGSTMSYSDDSTGVTLSYGFTKS